MARSFDMRTAAKRITSHAFGRSLLALKSADELALAAAAGAGLPRGAIGFVTVTANQAGITTEVDITGLTVTWTAATDRLYRVSVEAFMVTTVGTDTLSLKITNSANTQLQSHAIVGPTTASTKYQCAFLLTGASGSQTVKVRAVRAAGTGSVTFQAGATFPAYLLVEDLGLA